MSEPDVDELIPVSKFLLRRLRRNLIPQQQTLFLVEQILRNHGDLTIKTDRAKAVHELSE